MTQKLYILCEDEICYTESELKRQMKEHGWTGLTVEETKPMYGLEFFWCTEHGEMTERRYGWCGKECKEYNPRNGKSGRCKHNAYMREGTGKSKTIKI